MAMTIEGPIIPGRNGRILATYFHADVSPDHPAPIVLFCHGLPGNDPFEDLALSLQREGFHVMAFHYSGSWGSDGNYSIANGLDDTNTVLDYLLNQNDPTADRSRIYIAAHSLGGFFAAHTFARRPELKAAVLISPANMAGMYSYAVHQTSSTAAAASSSFADVSDANSSDNQNNISNIPSGESSANKDNTSVSALSAFRAELNDLCQPLNGITGDQMLAEIAAHEKEWQFSRIVSSFGTRPTLIFRGTRDDVTPSALCADILKDGLDHIPGNHARLVTFDTPHDYLNVREELLQTITDFYKNLPLR